LISIGAYQRGSNPKTDKAIEMYDKINDFLTQGTEEHTGWEMMIDQLLTLSGQK